MRRSGRRTFIQQTGTALLTGAYALDLSRSQRTRTPVADSLKVGLIGCGGRGTGAANEALLADPGVTITAMGDIFPGQIEQSLKGLTRFIPAG